MTQFTVYRNPNPETKDTYPYLLDIQSDLISDLSTRVVVPLAPATAMKDTAIKLLMPILDIEGKLHVMVTPQLAGISKKQLGALVADLSSERDAIIAALDLLITGI